MCKDDVIKNSYLLIVSPENMIRWFGCVLDQASQIDRTTNVDMHLGTAQNNGRGFYNLIGKHFSKSPTFILNKSW